MSDNLNRLEAVLFACGEPIEIERVAQAMQLSFEQVFELSEELEAMYNKDMRGIKLLRLDNKLQLCTRPEYFDAVRAILEIKRNTPLSQAAFEVLAVVAYNQPVTKAVVEQVRGVDCSGVMQSLSEKGLIEEKGRLDLPGRPLIYGTTDNFLRCFSLGSLGALPPIPTEENGEDEDENEV